MKPSKSSVALVKVKDVDDRWNCTNPLSMSIILEMRYWRSEATKSALHGWLTLSIGFTSYNQQKLQRIQNTCQQIKYIYSLELSLITWRWERSYTANLVSCFQNNMRKLSRWRNELRNWLKRHLYLNRAWWHVNTNGHFVPTLAARHTTQGKARRRSCHVLHCFMECAQMFQFQNG